MSMREGLRHHAVYFLTYYDADWNEVAGGTHQHTAGEMLECVEAWNRACQRGARNMKEDHVVPELPCFLTVEVRYVER